MALQVTQMAQQGKHMAPEVQRNHLLVLPIISIYHLWSYIAISIINDITIIMSIVKITAMVLITFVKNHFSQKTQSLHFHTIF